MASRSTLPVALTIAGSDSGGGAGIQADLATFQSLNVHGTSVLTAVTSQNPFKVAAIQPCTPAIVRSQLEMVSAGFSLKAAKTGMLTNARIVSVVVQFFRENRLIPLVVDPVMISSSGVALLDRTASRKVRTDLLPLASLVTPNLPEAEALLGAPIRGLEPMWRAACEIQKRFGCACLLKGGHMKGTKSVVDFYSDGKVELMLEAPRQNVTSLPGTGCTLSAAITAQIAHGETMEKAVVGAKDYMTQAIVNRHKVGRRSMLNHRWNARDSRG